jgi:hypothetical protein
MEPLLYQQPPPPQDPHFFQQLLSSNPLLYQQLSLPLNGPINPWTYNTMGYSGYVPSPQVFGTHQHQDTLGTYIILFAYYGHNH